MVQQPKSGTKTPADAIERNAANPGRGFPQIIGVFGHSELGAFVALLIIMVFFGYFGWERNFLTPLGVAGWANFASTVGIVALPVAFLMIAGELDISVGTMVPAAKMVLAITVGYYEMNVWFGIFLALAFTGGVGWVNGMLVTRTRVPSLIVTLATLFAVAGITLFLSLLLTNNPSSVLRDSHTDAVSEFIFGSYHAFRIGVGDNAFTLWQGLQSSVFIWVAMVAGCYFFLHLSPWGNWVFALGGDQESARNAGIPISRVKIGLFMLTAMSAALVGICETMLSNSATSTPQFSMIFNTIIAVVVGGVVLTGGFGNVLGVAFGTLTLAVVQQGINYTTFDRNLSSLIIGVMLLAAVLMNGTFVDMATRWSPSKNQSGADQ